MINNYTQKRVGAIIRQGVLGSLLIVTAMILILPSFISNQYLTTLNYGFILTNLLIGVVSWFMIVYETRKAPYSLHLIHWVFQFVFFFIASAVHYWENTFPWGFLTSNSEYLLKANLVILVWQFLWILATKVKSPNQVITKTKSDKTFVSYAKINFVFILSFLVMLYFIYLYGFSGLFTRGSNMTNLVDNSSFRTVITVTLRSIPVLLLTLIALKMRSNKGPILKIVLLIAIGITLLTNFPSATARYWAAAIYLGLFLTFFNIKSRNLVVFLLIFGLNVIFPILGGARRVETLGEFLSGISFSLGSNLTSGDYDAFSQIAHTMFYIDHYGITMGKQLLTVMLFFVPRSIWESKSIGSGYLVAEGIQLPFYNVSSPLPAEALINFGIIGVIGFAICISKLFSWLDKQYWEGNKPSIKIIYPFFIGFTFFVMRGDMLSSIAYIVGFSICFLLFKPKLKS
ncbi:oligosaccharide repeat unit polymerase [Enterococcus faecium]|nr:oligosaccharide repeat unit polymerase [Enterococcus faecium]